MPTRLVTTISDLHGVQFHVRIHYGWRAIVASWLIRLGAWVGGAKVEFLGSEDVQDA